MKKRLAKRLIASLLSIILISAALASCVGVDKKSAINFFEGHLNVIFHGEYGDEYLRLSDSDRATAEEKYSNHMSAAAYRFAVYWDIMGEKDGMTVLDAELKADIIGLLEKIYARTRYSVSSAEEVDGHWVYTVSVEPVMIMQRAKQLYDSNGYAPLADYRERTKDTDWDSLDIDEHIGLIKEYGGIVVDMVESLLPELSYGSAETVTVKAREVGTHVDIGNDAVTAVEDALILFP